MIIEEHRPLLGYQLLDSGGGYRYERFGEYTLVRPDPAALWKKSLPEGEWRKADAVFVKTGQQKSEAPDGSPGKNGEKYDTGKWKLNQPVPEKWLMKFRINEDLGSEPENEINFYAKLTPFKHTGVFPEQAPNWNFIANHLSLDTPKKGVKLLNLFGYTGIASVLAAKLGAEVTHVDASKPSISWARENMLASGLPENAIRWIYDDVLKFVKREARRGNKYDAVILDPPAYGRGPKGEVWKFPDIAVLLSELGKICSGGDDFKFLIVNAYAVSISSVVLKNLLEDFKTFMTFGPERKIDYGELILREKDLRTLSTGLFARLY